MDFINFVRNQDSHWLLHVSSFYVYQNKVLLACYQSSHLKLELYKFNLTSLQTYAERSVTGNRTHLKSQHVVQTCMLSKLSECQNVEKCRKQT